MPPVWPFRSSSPIAGHVLKRGGELTHVDWDAVKRMVGDSRDFVLKKSGFRPPKL